MQIAQWVKHEGLTRLIEEDEIRQATFRMATKINDSYEAAGVKEVIVIVNLKGAFIFAADLVRDLGTLALMSDRPVDYKIDFFQASSYEKKPDSAEMESSGTVKIIMDVSTDIAGRHGLFVEDILDTALTLEKSVAHLQFKGPASLKVACLFTKETSPKNGYIDFLGTVLPPKYVWGHGLDKDQTGRNWPGIWCNAKP